MKTFNQHVVKKENKSLVLHVIKENAPISRAEVAVKTGLNKGTVSSLVTELIEEDLLLESGPGLSSGGRRPVMLLFNQKAGYSIGVDIGVNYILGILTDLQGDIREEELVHFNSLSLEEVKGILFETIDKLLALTPKSTYGAVGIGVGVPGTVSSDGNILLAPNLGWKNVPLKSILEEKYQLPVCIENEANAGAHGEKCFGTGTNLENIVYVSGGIGIGVGLILDGNLYKGTKGLSGELGHMTIESHGIECRCGNKGCWELYASEKALINRSEELGISGSKKGDNTLEILLQHAADGEAETLMLFREIGSYLGIGISNIINIFNPEQVIIGNRIALCEDLMKDALMQEIQERALSSHQKEIRIDFSILSSHSTALGVASFTSDNFLTSDLQAEIIV